MKIYEPAIAGKCKETKNQGNTTFFLYIDDQKILERLQKRFKEKKEDTKAKRKEYTKKRNV